MNTQYFKASKNPSQAIATVTYSGQELKRRLYQAGYESYMDALPVLNASDVNLTSKLQASQSVMNALASELVSEGGWATEEDVPDGDFKRVIIAIEDPLVSIADEHLAVTEGKEIIVAKWGDGFSSPVHGHAAGFLHEELLSGQMLVHLYRMISPESNVVRPVSTDIYKGHKVIASSFSTPPADAKFKRQSLVHNFQSIGQSSSLHYVPEHTRDGRDNSFKVEFFDDKNGLSIDEVTQITGRDGMYLRKGEVCLVRSTNVPEYGDHYIVITGQPVMKEHGLRPKDVAIQAPSASSFLNQFELRNGLTLLKLKPEAARRFREFHGINIENGEVIFPKA